MGEHLLLVACWMGSAHATALILWQLDCDTTHPAGPSRTFEPTALSAAIAPNHLASHPLLFSACPLCSTSHFFAVQIGNSSAPRQAVMARWRFAVGAVTVVILGLAALSATQVHLGGDEDDAQVGLLEELPGGYVGRGTMLADHYDKELRQSKDHCPPRRLTISHALNGWRNRRCGEKERVGCLQEGSSVCPSFKLGFMAGS